MTTMALRSARETVRQERYAAWEEATATSNSDREGRRGREMMGAPVIGEMVVWIVLDEVGS